MATKSEIRKNQVQSAGNRSGINKNNKIYQFNSINPNQQLQLQQQHQPQQYSMNQQDMQNWCEEYDKINNSMLKKKQNNNNKAVSPMQMKTLKTNGEIIMKQNNNQISYSNQSNSYLPNQQMQQYNQQQIQYQHQMPPMQQQQIQYQHQMPPIQEQQIQYQQPLNKQLYPKSASNKNVMPNIFHNQGGLAAYRNNSLNIDYNSNNNHQYQYQQQQQQQQQQLNNNSPIRNMSPKKNQLQQILKSERPIKTGPFSQKRYVEFNAYTLLDYKHLTRAPIVMGPLGANIGTKDWEEKKLKRERKELYSINVTKDRQGIKSIKKDTPQDEISKFRRKQFEESIRCKTKEYAKIVHPKKVNPGIMDYYYQDLGVINEEDKKMQSMMMSHEGLDDKTMSNIKGEGMQDHSININASHDSFAFKNNIPMNRIDNTNENTIYLKPNMSENIDALMRQQQTYQEKIDDIKESLLN